MEKELEWVNNCVRILGDIGIQLAKTEESIKEDNVSPLNLNQLRSACHTLINLKNQINAELRKT